MSYNLIAFSNFNFDRGVYTLKRKRIVASLIILIICLGCIVSGFMIKHLLHEYKELGNAPVSLSDEQKLEDFEQFYDLMCKEAPFLDDVKETYGIDFVANKDYYEGKILSTKTDVEFLSTMNAICMDVCSYHTNITVPYPEAIKDNFKYPRSLNLISKFVTKKKLKSWEKKIRDEASNYNISDFVDAVYYDGCYYCFDSDLISEDKDKCVDLELIEINGREPKDFLLDGIYWARISYDEKRDVIYRSYVTFNKLAGEPVNTVWKDESGEIYEKELYYSISCEMLSDYGFLFNDNLIPYPIVKDKSKVYHYCDEDNEVDYVRIKSFNSGELDVKKVLKNIKYDNVIIDLRNNGGGKYDFGERFVYPYLYSEDVSYTDYWKESVDYGDRSHLSHIVNRIQDNGEDEKYCYFRRDYKMKGKIKSPKNVVYLVNSGSGSATDAYVAHIKDNNLGVIIGSTTGGEGKAGPVIHGKLNNSGLLFSFFYSIRCDENGNSIYSRGTEPDIQITLTKEDNDNLLVYRKEGTHKEYKNMLEFDPVLNRAIEYFNGE